MDNINTTHTLANGLRLVHVRTASPVAWCGLAVNAGSREVGEGRYGLAHFVEHTIFKGTTHRRSWHIINRMESVGGELNAYTTKEHTMVYSVFPAQHLARAVELIADLVKNSTFPHDEIERERDVVLEEADSYRDTPSDAVYDDHEDILWAGSALGHNILGVEEHLRGMGSEQCMDYLKSLYVPDNMAFFVVGPMAPDRVFRLAERHLGSMSCPLHRQPRVAPPEVAPSRHTVELGLHQAHTVVGMRLPSMYSDERYCLSLLNNILGGPGMNSPRICLHCGVEPEPDERLRHDANLYGLRPGRHSLKPARHRPCDARPGQHPAHRATPGCRQAAILRPTVAGLGQCRVDGHECRTQSAVPWAGGHAGRDYGTHHLHHAGAAVPQRPPHHHGPRHHPHLALGSLFQQASPPLIPHQRNK